MEALVVFLRLAFLLFAALRSTSAQNDPAYVKIGGPISLKPDTPGPFINILWKHKGNLVVEWVNYEEDVYGMFRNRTTLDKTTGRVDITNPTEDFAGLYTVEINSRVQSKGYDVKFIEEITKVELVVRPLVCNSETKTCTLACGPDDTSGFGPLTYSWREDDGQWRDGEQTKEINNDDTTKKIKTFSCQMENKINQVEIGSHDNPFYIEQPPGSNGGAIVGGILALLAVGAVVAVGVAHWFKGILNTCLPGSLHRGLGSGDSSANRNGAAGNQPSSEIEGLKPNAPTSNDATP